MSMHDGHRQRMKEEFLARPDSFPDHKLLEMLLFYANPRGDTNPTAHALLERFNSLAGVLDALPEELMKVPGVGEHAVVLLKTAKELSGRYLVARTNMDEIVQTVEDAYPILRPYFFGARGERVCLLCLDGKRKNLGIRQIAEGCVNSAAITTRLVMEATLSLNATQVILAHNHISGVALPSKADEYTTTYLRKALVMVEVDLWDHLIFSDDDMVSIRQTKPYLFED